MKDLEGSGCQIFGTTMTFSIGNEKGYEEIGHLVLWLRFINSDGKLIGERLRRDLLAVLFEILVLCTVRATTYTLYTEICNTN